MKAATAVAILAAAVGEFQSTPPVKAATIQRLIADTPTVISIHAAREGGDWLTCRARMRCGISIHAAREGGDANGINGLRHNLHFNPRRP